MKAVEKAQGKAPKFEKDIRKVVEDKDIDIVSIATPNHWHALMAVWAMQNGKDVYVEKPVSHNVREGAIMADAARKYKRICQAGTQSRSNPGMREAIAYVQSGKIGKVDLASGLCYKPRGSIGKVDGRRAEAARDDGLRPVVRPGPAQDAAPEHRRQRHGPLRLALDLGLRQRRPRQPGHPRDGQGPLGPGQDARCRTRVVSVGGRFGYVDDGETANTQLCVFDYGDGELIFEVRGLPTGGLQGREASATSGSAPRATSSARTTPAASPTTRTARKSTKFNGGDDQYHFDNFVKAVRSRKVEDLNGDIAEGHLSAALCHLANISYRLGTETADRQGHDASATTRLRTSSPPRCSLT